MGEVPLCTLAELGSRPVDETNDSVMPASLGKKTHISDEKQTRLFGSHKPRGLSCGGVFFKPLLRFHQLLAAKCPGFLRNPDKLTFEYHHERAGVETPKHHSR